MQKIEFMVWIFLFVIFDFRCFYGFINVLDRLEIYYLFLKYQKKILKFYVVFNIMVENLLIWVNNFLIKCIKFVILNLKINDFLFLNLVIDYIWVLEDIIFLSGL